MAKKTKMVSPQKAKTDKVILGLAERGKSIDGYTLFMSSKVVGLSALSIADDSSVGVDIGIPRAAFDALVKWYQTPQKVKP